ncbi:conserved Plasmodium protein, unknown function [Plasmodium gallinaceum]|uniref:Uncharacterized protein n=1 Tax=Plasmodium gallinaceum TaxID=5849 RepID=A0A1J1GVW8_PLAGA|nr:conserved Plasmodium protein, unknown function [Plasmodium gallinaceum]CRG96406.1 conserved Plasmodium protein, unknown function [Plasmodium gallinaceum]
MKTILVLFLIQIFLCFYQKNVVSKNIKFNIDGNMYTILYDKKKVKFSDLDLLKIMFHSNHIKHCGNSVIRYILKLSTKNLFQMDFVVKHIDITYNKVLKFDDKYKIIGAITNYGNTSLRVSLFGVGNENKKISLNSFIKNKLSNNLELESQSDKNEENSINEVLDNYDEDNDDPINLSSKEIDQLKEEKNCAVYFIVHYTLVKVDKKGMKKNIKDQFKNENSLIEIEQIENLASALC